MNAELLQVNAFTGPGLLGNPAGICLLEKAASESWMSQAAIQMGCSATSFIVPRNENNPDEESFSIRWFTPELEIPLCGHGTVASAYYLFSQGCDKSKRIHFRTAAGRDLYARHILMSDGSAGVELEFPRPNYSERELIGNKKNFELALGTSGECYYSKDLHYFLMQLESEDDIRTLKPNFEILRQAGNYGFIVTAKASSPSKYDFVSRFFAPSHGVEEDHVCGSAHCFMGAFWESRLHKNSLVGRQLSARGGQVSILVKQDKVLLSGQAEIEHGKTQRCEQKP